MLGVIVRRFAEKSAIAHPGCVCLVTTVVFKHHFKQMFLCCPVFCCRNCDGFIDREEFGDILHMTGEAVTEEDIDEMFGESDTNKDGKIDFDGTTQTTINAVANLWSCRENIWTDR